jgi:hypothetical protein
MDELGRANIDAARRLGGDQQSTVATEFASEDDLLLIAAGERAHRRAY